MGELVDTYRYGQQLSAFLATLPSIANVVISYHRRETSRVRGYHNVTMKRLACRYGKEITWREDNALPLHVVQVTTRDGTWHLAMNDGTNKRIR